MTFLTWLYELLTNPMLWIVIAMLAVVSIMVVGARHDNQRRAAQRRAAQRCEIITPTKRFVVFSAYADEGTIRYHALDGTNGIIVGPCEVHDLPPAVEEQR